MDDLDQRIKKAENATPGPWAAVEGAEAYSIQTPDSESLTWDDHGGEVFTEADADFIATWDPSFAQEVGQRLKAAESKVKRVEELLTGSETISADALREALGG